MYTITKVINNLQKYHNCDVYIPFEDESFVSIIRFVIDEKDVLTVKVFLNKYSGKPYWNGQEKNKNCRLEDSNCLLEQAGGYLNFIITNIINSDFFGKKALVEADSTKSYENISLTVNRLLNLVNNMLSFEEKDYNEIIPFREIKVFSLLMKKASSRLLSVENLKSLESEIEMKMENLNKCSIEGKEQELLLRKK